MRQNCAVTCETVEAVGAGEGPDHITCARWAMMNYCDEGHAHATFMKQSCPEACKLAAERDPNDGKPPPADVFVWLLVCGFGYVVFYAVRRAIAADGEVSSVVASKSLGVVKTVGPGKPNKSAMGAQKRSAKKTS